MNRLFFSGDPNRQTVIAQQMERKQHELMEAKWQEEQLLAEAERRSVIQQRMLSEQAPTGETPPPLPTMPPPAETPPLATGQTESAGQR